MLRWIILLAIAFLPALAGAQINTLPSAPHLLVRGHADGKYVPDRFTINLQIQVTNMQPDVARTKVEAHMRQILAALDQSGALKDRTQASSLAIQPDNEYRNDKNVFVGTRVTRTVSATFDDLNKLKNFISEVPANEEVQIQSTEVGRSDAKEISMELRKRAMANSQQAAKSIAAAYGLSIKGIYSVSEVAPDFAYGIQAGSWGDIGDNGMPAPPSPQVLNTVVVTGSILPDAALRVGTIELKQDIYAVYLTESK